MMAIILARRGSKRFPHKNVTDIATSDGPKNMVEMTLRHAFLAFPDALTVLATDYMKEEVLPLTDYVWDDNHFRYVCRPENLCLDGTTSEAVVAWILDQIPREEAFVLMQPTSPMRYVGELRQARERFEESGVPALISINPAYQPNGSFYFCRVDAFRRHGTWWVPGMEVWMQSWEESIDVNYLHDLRIAEAVLSRRQ